MPENNGSSAEYMVMDDSCLFYAEIYSRDIIKKALRDKLLLLLICKKNNIEPDPRSYLARLELELKKRGIEITGDIVRLECGVKALGIDIDEIMDSDPDAYYHFRTKEEFTLEEKLSFLKCSLELNIAPTDAGLMSELKKYGLRLAPDTDIKQLAENLRLIRQYDSRKQGA